MVQLSKWYAALEMIFHIFIGLELYLATATIEITLVTLHNL